MFDLFRIKIAGEERRSGGGGLGDGRQRIPSLLFTSASDFLGAACLCPVGITH